MIKKLSIKDYHFLQDYLIKNISDKKRIESIQGFMASIICAPSLVPPSDWLGYIFEDDNGENHDLKYEKITKDIVDMILTMYNETVDSINNMQFKPLISIDKKELIPEDAKFWCKGFMEGISTWNENFEEYIEDEKFRDLITPMLLLLDPAEFFKTSDGGIKNLNDAKKNEFKNQALDDIGRSVVALRYYLIDENEEEDYGFEEKISRNEPCPCGSGKKYKKCCGS